jgi:hypothetical protein
MTSNNKGCNQQKKMKGGVEKHDGSPIGQPWLFTFLEEQSNQITRDT